MILDEIKKTYTKDVFELNNQGINHQSYWAARMGLTDDELRNFLYDHVLETLAICKSRGMDLSLALMVVAGQCFSMGFIFGKGDEL